jgi:hypothetical protein
MRETTTRILRGELRREASRSFVPCSVREALVKRA